MDEKYRDDSDVSEADDDDDSTSGVNNAAPPIMSLFASFYGIEDPTKNTEINGGRGTIDDANFAADDYVKELLAHESVEGLTVKDAEMVHEIRVRMTLDGEMQKLVYDNYNKFITATETIKEMKKDVYSMDDDMNSVRVKMNKISDAAKDLDNLLDEKRVKVDKIVRVRRLLYRLEFLSELPERLAAMIDNKQYIEAVKLYNKTISVLTRHSHVLSFKKIKERTELMMADLTEKVIDMLDDSTLEAVKLTQFISILRLMNAPRDKVFKKFLSAHQRRSTTMTSQFHESVENGSFSVASARQYHQSILVGLIEACKGITELYQGTNDVPDVATSSSSSTISLSQIEVDFYNSIQKTVYDYSKAMVKGFHAFFLQFHEIYQDFNLELSPLNEEDLQTIKQELNLDLISVTQTVRKTEETEDYKSSSAQFHYQDERGSWLLLARQSILDVKYLDSTFTETRSMFQQISGKKRGILGELFSSNFADGLLIELDFHITFMRKHFLKSYVNELLNWYPRHVSILDVTSLEVDGSAVISSSSAATASPTHPTSASVSSPPTAAGERTSNLFQKKWQSIQILMKLVSLHASEAFSECARYIKPLVDIYEVASLDPSILCKKLIIEFSTFLVQEIETSCGIIRYRTVLKDKKMTLEEEDHEIAEMSELDFQKAKGLMYDRHSQSKVQGNILLYFAGVLRSLLRSLPTIVHEELSSHEFPPIEDISLEQALSQRKMEETIRDLITYFTEVNARFASESFASCCFSHFQRFSSKVSQGEISTSLKSLTISDQAKDFLLYLDGLAHNGYLFFLEASPQVRGNSGLDRDLARRGGGRQSVVVGNNLALQMDIERLFSQRVKIFSPINTITGNEVIVNTIIKAAIKAVQEEMRNATLVYEAYVQIRAEVTLVKSVAAYLIRETSELDSLVDLALSTVFSRYLGANDIANVTDTTEAGLVSKAHSEALQDLSGKVSLIGRIR